MLVFVYGTLMKGFYNDYLLANCKYIGKYSIKGELYDLGFFPGLIEGDGKVYGEVYEVDKYTLKALDNLEGFSEDGYCFYKRKEVFIPEFGKKVWTYFYNNDVYERELIEGGDYYKYIKNQTKEKMYGNQKNS